MQFITGDYHMLTGAGFTYNFGTPLAKEMWAEIFNNKKIQRHERLRELLLSDFDYESIYHKVFSESIYSEDEQEAITFAMRRAYESLDSIVMKYNFTGDNPIQINIYGIQKFLSLFGEKGPGGIFTLNQDLFLERKYYNGVTPQLPGISQPYNSHWFTTHFNYPIREEHLIHLPTHDQLIELKGRLVNSKLNYIKLHGSFNWRSSAGKHQMVIGKGKIEQIGQEPLLAWYLELFRNTLVLNGEKRLLVVGYSFSDDHINEILSEGIANAGLKLYVLNPTAINHFKEFLLTRHRGEIIWRGLTGYFPYTLAQIFPINQDETVQFSNLKAHFFE